MEKHTEKRLGKILSIKVGMGGYDDVMFGASFSLGGDGWGTMDFWGTWTTKITSSTKWTEEDRKRHFGDVMYKLWKLIEDAKVSNVNALEGIPVEVTFEDFTLKSWRILTEVR